MSDLAGGKLASVGRICVFCGCPGKDWVIALHSLLGSAHGGPGSLLDSFKASLSRSLSGIPLSADSPLDSDAFSPFEYQLETSLTVLGQTDPLTYRGDLAVAQQLAAGGIFKDAAQLIDKRASELSDDQKNAILAVKSIFIFKSDGTTFEGTNTKTGQWSISSGYLQLTSTMWLASLFSHEGQHILNYQHHLYQRSFVDELTASIRQKDVGRKLGFSDAQINYINWWISDFQRLQRHIDHGLITK